MLLEKIQVQDFRNLRLVELSPASAVNFIVGQNGSGKSSLLEAIHYLGYGRSFRTNKHRSVICNEQHNFSIFVKGSNNGIELKLGMRRDRDDKAEIKINGEKAKKASDLVSHLPVQVFTPQSSDLLLGSPNLRRRFLDWGLFHVEQSFFSLSNRYAKLLKNKNALLKNISSNGNRMDSSQTQFWDMELAKTGEDITTARKSSLDALQPYINANLEQFLPEFCFKISYYRGWEKGHSLIESMALKQEKDTRYGFLSVGPHKADLKVKVDGTLAIEVLSRGQLRMLVAALQLAQTQYLKDSVNKNCIFLLDDVGAELDENKREIFIDKLIETNAQIFVTAIDETQLAFIDKYKNKKMFHVEHGQVREEI